MTGRPARYSCEFKYVLFFSVMVQGQLPNNFALKNSCAMFYPFGPSWSRMAVLGQQSNIDMEDVRYLGPFTYAVKRKFLLGVAVPNEM